MACSSNEPTDPPEALEATSVTELFNNTQAHLFRTRGGGYSSDEAVIARVEGARLSEDGSLAVVLDAVAPYVKTFARNGDPVAAFVATGAGPGEARDPYALGIADSKIMLLHSGPAIVLTDDGQFVSQKDHQDLGFRPLAVASGCGDQWYFYGPRSLRNDDKRNAWLYRLPVDASENTVPVPVYEDTVFPSSIGFGAIEGLIGSDEGVGAYHDHGRPPAVVELSCDDAPQASRVAGLTSLLTTGDETVEERSGNQLALSIPTGSRSFAGIARLNGAWLLAQHVNTGPDDPSITELSLVTSDSIFRAGVQKYLTIHDSKPGLGVLFSINDLVPRIFLVREDHVLSAFREVPRANRSELEREQG